MADVSDPVASSRSASSLPASLTEAAAVEQARAAAAETAGDPAVVGEHLGIEPEIAVPVTGEVQPEVLGATATHTFESRLPGYVGWHWAVTVAAVPGDDEVTVDEVVLLPGEQALLAPAWVPWHERLRPGDLSVGTCCPPRRTTRGSCRPTPPTTTPPTTPRAASSPSSWAWAASGSCRPRAAPTRSRRWADGDFGPASAMARSAPGACVTCGFWLPLAGSLRQRVGACGNAYAPADGRVVTADYGCGAHSQATLVAADTSEVIHTARYDTGTYDVLSD